MFFFLLSTQTEKHLRIIVERVCVLKLTITGPLNMKVGVANPNCLAQYLMIINCGKVSPILNTNSTFTTRDYLKIKTKPRHMSWNQQTIGST